MIKKDIILSEQDIGSFFYSFLKREYKSDSDLQNNTRRKGLLWQAHSRGGGGGGVLKKKRVKFELGTEVQPNVSTTTL